MLFRAVHMPRLYQDLPTADAEQKRYCSSILPLMQSAADNLVLLVDEDGRIRSSIVESISRWPISHRKLAQLLLLRLEHFHRFVTVKSTPAEGDCGFDGCSYARAIAQSTTHDVTVAASNCVSCLKWGLPNLTNEGDYCVSTFFQRSVNARTLEVRDRQYSKQEFAALFLYPLLRHASWLRIIDRWVGRHIFTANGVEQSYRETLEWIVQEYKNLHPKGGARVTIVTGVQVRHEHADEFREALASAEQLRRLRDELSSQTGVPIELDIRFEKPTAELPHARYMFTDQFNVMIDRGASLVDRNGRIRDVFVSQVRKPGEVMAQVQSLRKVPLSL